jgi:hypothetical protein
MNINPKDILPCERDVPEQILIKDSSVLSEHQIIQVQKFFIKKLIQKLNS